MSKRSWHLFEFSDLTWFPTLWRSFLTDLLDHHYRTSRVYHAAIPILYNLIRRSGYTQICDLCSGTGGPWPDLAPLLKQAVPRLKVTLTDKYPPAIAQLSKDWTYAPASLDINSFSFHEPALYTLFTSFHHLKPAMATQVLKNVTQSGHPIGIFEFTENRWANKLGMFLSPLYVWAISFSVSPRSPWRFLWTYLLPVVPLIYWWDGLISHGRTYSLEEMESMAEAFPNYHWEVGRSAADEQSQGITWMIGWKKLQNDG